MPAQPLPEFTAMSTPGAQVATVVHKSKKEMTDIRNGARPSEVNWIDEKNISEVTFYDDLDAISEKIDAENVDSVSVMKKKS
jgi:hypothetical protein